MLKQSVEVTGLKGANHFSTYGYGDAAVGLHNSSFPVFSIRPFWSRPNIKSGKLFWKIDDDNESW